MNEATSVRKLFGDTLGNTQGSYTGIALVVGVVGMAAFGALGQSYHATLNTPVNSTPPELDSTSFISTHDPTYSVGSITLGSEDPVNDPNGSGQNGSNTGGDSSNNDGSTDLDDYNECVAQATALPEEQIEAAIEQCASDHLGEDVTSFPNNGNDGAGGADDPLGDNGSGSGNGDLGSNGQAGSGDFPPAPDYGGGGNNGGGLLGGLIDGVGDFFEGKSLGSMVGGVASTVGRGFMGALAGTGGAMIGGVTGLISGEGFINGAKSGWSDGWNACQDGPVLSMGCAGRAAVAVAAPVIVVAGAKAIGITAAGAAMFAAKSLAAGVVYTFFLNGDSLRAAWQDTKTSFTERRFTASNTASTIGGKISGCLDSLGSCAASIATGAAVYGGLRGASFLAGRALQSAFVGGKLAPLFARYPWLAKVPGFRQAGQGAQSATALQAGAAAGGGRYSVEGALQGGRWAASTTQPAAAATTSRGLEVVGASVRGGRHVVRGNVAQRPMSAAARYIDPNTRVASTSGIRTAFGNLLEKTFIGGPAFVAPHVAAGLATDHLTDNTAPSQNMASWFDEQDAVMQDAEGFSLDQIHSQIP